MPVAVAEYQDFFENMAVPLHIVGSDGTIRHANKAELDLLGYSAEDYIGRDLSDFHADRATVVDILARLAKGETLKSCPASLLAKDGSLRHVEITSSGRFQDGDFVSTRCLTLDVTELKLAHEQREATEQHWRTALNALPGAIYTTDGEGRINYFNAAAAELTGRTPELGTDAWCRTWKLFKLDGSPLPYDESPMAMALKTNKPIRGIEVVAERRDGKRLRLLPYPIPLHGRNGDLTGTVNLLVDVTQQRESEAAEARLAAIVVSSNDAIVSKTLDGIVTSWNVGAARLFGFDASEIVGQPIMRIIPSELRDEEKEILAKLRRGECIEHYDTVRIAKNGRRIDVSLSISPVRDRSGNLIGAAKVARDITQRRKLEKTQRLLMAELNHRVKNTLAIVQALATQTLRFAATPAEFVSSFVGRIRSLSVTHDLLTHADWQGVELTELIKAQTGADTDERISCAGPEILLPPQLASTLALVFHELGTNALKHGALSVATGRVLIEWAIAPAPIPGLHLRWTEAGVPSPHMESKPNGGLGRTMIEHSIKAIAGGKSDMRREPHGVVWDIALSLPQSSVVI